jgi:outer membrane protein OmpA-like peptidoglycan-associated protein
MREVAKMKLKNFLQLLILFSLLLKIEPSFTQGKDVPGSKDHPIISRYPGSYIYHYDQKEFDELEILLSPIKGSSDKDVQLAKREKLEGKVTKIQYQVPKNRSCFEVFKNYEEAVKRANFDILYSVRGKEIVGIRRFLDPYFWNVYASQDDEKNFFYLSAKNRSKNIALSVCVLPHYDGPIVLLGIVETKGMETGLIKAQDIYERIKSEGKVTIYGIYFDFDKAEIKPESKPTIEEIAKFLKEHPEIKLYIVGHTDNVGKLEYNMELSKKRAEAVIKELVEKYGIQRERLMGFGVGPLAPVASNSTEEGRAKNRRVELVEQ